MLLLLLLDITCRPKNRKLSTEATQCLRLTVDVIVQSSVMVRGAIVLRNILVLGELFGILEYIIFCNTRVQNIQWVLECFWSIKIQCK